MERGGREGRRKADHVGVRGSRTKGTVLPSPGVVVALVVVVSDMHNKRAESQVNRTKRVEWVSEDGKVCFAASATYS